jgi:hypothetical protein
VEPGDHPRLLQDAIIKHVQLQGRIDELTARADKLAEALENLRKSCRYCERMGVHSGRECAEADIILAAHRKEG